MSSYFLLTGATWVELIMDDIHFGPGVGLLKY